MPRANSSAFSAALWTRRGSRRAIFFASERKPRYSLELTVALHYVFDTPRDRLVWDVGHQAYPHKILTGRRDRIRTLRQGGGLSGFTKRSESEYDPFGAAHSSTSISASLGFAVANKIAGKPGKGIAVIGDGAMSAGMAYEAMNNAAQAGNRLVVQLVCNCKAQRRADRGRAVRRAEGVIFALGAFGEA